MSLNISNKELQKSRDDERIVRETAMQVIKDFGLFGMEVNFPSDIHWAYEQLFEQLHNYVSTMLNENNKKLLSLLYQIDVSEQKILSESKNQADKDLSEIVTELILDRELKKVITRNYFKNKPRDPA